MATDGKLVTSRPIAAAIDIGSNSIKMTVAQPDGNGGLTQLDWASEVVRLGQGVATSGRLDDARIGAALESLHRFANRAREQGATRIVAVATEATRVAENGEEFLNRVREQTGIDVRAVNGDAEAALTFRGLSATVDLGGQVVIADIGGGSTEIIVANGGALQKAISIPLGSGRLTEQFLQSDPPTRAELTEVEAEAAKAIARAAGSLGFESARGMRLIVVGGTGEYMARLVPDATAISNATVRRVLADLEMVTAAELAAQIDIPEARARVLPVGVVIVAAMAERVGPDRIEIAYSGVRAGLLLETFDDWNQQASAVADAELRNPGPGFRDAMRSLIAERWSAVWTAIPVALEGSDIEGVHDVRVASRRLRAAMDIAAPVFPQRWFRSLHRTAKEITGALGEVRDRDVLLEAFRADRERAPLPERPGIDRLIERVDRERVAARIEMESFLRDLLSGPVGTEIERRFGELPRSENGEAS